MGEILVVHSAKVVRNLGEARPVKQKRLAVRYMQASWAHHIQPETVGAVQVGLTEVVVAVFVQVGAVLVAFQRFDSLHSA